jgi:ABC-type polysaccharide/polyol phosphate export permease
MAWMFLTPVMYPVTILPENYRFFLTMLNPMYHFVTLFRIPVYFGRIPNAPELLIPLGISLFFLILGWLVFTNKSDEFSYRI